MSDLKDIAKLIASGDMDSASTSFVNNAFSKLIEGKLDYEIYHDSYSDAVAEALRLAETNGYTYDEEEYFSKVSTGPRKPGVGETNRVTIRLYRDDKPVKRMLAFQVYGLDSGRYELNAYLT